MTEADLPKEIKSQSKQNSQAPESRNDENNKEIALSSEKDKKVSGQ